MKKQKSWDDKLIAQMSGLTPVNRDEPLACPDYTKGADSTRSPAPWYVKDKATGTPKERYTFESGDLNSLEHTGIVEE